VRREPKIPKKSLHLIEMIVLAALCSRTPTDQPADHRANPALDLARQVTNQVRDRSTRWVLFEQIPRIEKISGHAGHKALKPLEDGRVLSLG